MNSISEQKPISARFAAAVFFGIFAFLFLIFTRYTLLPLKASQGFPLGYALIVVPFIGILLGALFGNQLAKPSRWWRPFLLGILLAIVYLLIISLAVLVNSYWNDPNFARLSVKDNMVVFGAIYLSATLIIGLWLIPVTALAAVYFNKHFFPGLRAVDKRRHKEL
ncbi:hypothetical protein Lqui_1528 [Legionella quinlivanii]|uniref:Transmembrane protein n=1 Tax=Legionella quinlivanii TaxID=45073 RepID=A0A0W0XZN8_9GAMM|nr:hypothetical protein [Legionella quinlivanii]KTD50203.1 hypothetical protein Lqui_1528 [Legionella quinlivanii]MCW8450052.1 SoxR reducing system RseC family protein [Legionella quinlivanii]SEF47651.1 hypothetical protein SAMN02746093_00309 [Legionella quinlivanii DSM 21216]STY11801.1 Uncharacterised protein [Legionella quinlivanii]